MDFKEQIEFEKYSKFVELCEYCHGSGRHPGSLEAKPETRCKFCLGEGKPLREKRNE